MRDCLVQHALVRIPADEYEAIAAALNRSISVGVSDGCAVTFEAGEGIRMLKSPSGSTILKVMIKKISSRNTMSIIGVICNSILSSRPVWRIFMRLELCGS